MKPTIGEIEALLDLISCIFFGTCPVLHSRYLYHQGRTYDKLFGGEGDLGTIFLFSMTNICGTRKNI